jgi:hypothetical protein
MRPLGCSHILVIKNSAAKNFGVQGALLSYPGAHSFEYVPSSGMAALYDHFLSSFLRNIHIALLSGYTNSHS